MLSAVVRIPCGTLLAPASKNAVGRSSAVRMSRNEQLHTRGWRPHFPVLPPEAPQSGLRDTRARALAKTRCTASFSRRETLGSNTGRHQRQPGDVPPGRARLATSPVATGSPSVIQDDRDRASCVLRGLSGRRGGYDDNVRLKSQAVASKRGKPLAMALSGEVVDGDGLPVHITQIAPGLGRAA